MALSLESVVIDHKSCLKSVYRQGREICVATFEIGEIDRKRVAIANTLWKSSPTDQDFTVEVKRGAEFNPEHITDKTISEIFLKNSFSGVKDFREIESRVEREWSNSFSTVVNPDAHSPRDKPTSALKKTLIREGVRNVKVSAPFDVGDAQSRLFFLNRDGLIKFEDFPQGRKLIAEMNRDSDNASCGLLAFLQGVLAADEMVRRNTGSIAGFRLGGDYRRSASNFSRF